MKKQILVVALAVLALFGCTSLFPPEKTMASPDRPLVTIANGQVSRVDPDPLTFRPEQKNVVIIWELDEVALRAGFRFAPARGISIDRQVEGQPRDLAQEFPERAQVPGGKQFRVLNKNSGGGKYKYSIVIVDPAGRELPPFDPFIVNQQ